MAGPSRCGGTFLKVAKKSHWAAWLRLMEWGVDMQPCSLKKFELVFNQACLLPFLWSKPVFSDLCFCSVGTYNSNHIRYPCFGLPHLQFLEPSVDWQTSDLTHWQVQAHWKCSFDWILGGSQRILMYVEQNDFNWTPWLHKILASSFPGRFNWVKICKEGISGSSWAHLTMTVEENSKFFHLFFSQKISLVNDKPLTNGMWVVDL